MYHNCYLIKCQWPLGWVFQKEGLKKACHGGCGTDYKGGRKESCFGNWGCSAVLCLTWSNHKDFKEQRQPWQQGERKTGGGKTVMSSKKDPAQKSSVFEFSVYCFTCCFSWQLSGVRRSAIITISIWRMKTLTSWTPVASKKKKNPTNFVFWNHFNLQKTYKNRTESSCVLFPQSRQPKDSLSLPTSEAKWG